MTTTILTGKDINAVLTVLRDQLRNGVVALPLRWNRNALRNDIASRLGLEGYAFNTGNFHPKTLQRFATLFDIPVGISQDDTAWALQNFMNRRKDPWAFARAKGNTELNHNQVAL